MTQFAELRSIDVVPDDERHGRAFSRCTPWSAINLTDYYLIPKERYGIPALSGPRGRYGAWCRDALVVCAVGLLAQLPFLVTYFGTGPLVERLGGAGLVDRGPGRTGAAVPAARPAHAPARRPPPGYGGYPQCGRPRRSLAWGA